MTEHRDPNRDPDRLIEAFLSEGQTDLPESAYGVIRTEINKPPRTPWWRPVGALAAVAAGVVMVAILSSQLWPGLVGGTPSPSALPSATSPDAYTPFVCGQPIAVPTSWDFQLTPVSIRDIELQPLDASGPSAYDQIVITFDNGTPSLDLAPVSAAPIRDASGQLTEVAGESVWRLNLSLASKFTDRNGPGPIPTGTPDSYQGTTDFRPNSGEIAQFVEDFDSGRVSSWYLGLRHDACIQVDRLGNKLLINVRRDAPPNPQPSASPTAWECGQPFTFQSSGQIFSPTVIEDIQVRTADATDPDSHDEIFFTFRGERPTLLMELVGPDNSVDSAQRTLDADGQPMEVAGDPVWRVALSRATRRDEMHMIGRPRTVTYPYQGSTDFRPTSGDIAEFVESADFGGLDRWYLGLRQDDCIRASGGRHTLHIIIGPDHPSAP